ncbi:hypothetical protein Hanom_Chr11g01043391 [Helianthus anomalus]
MHVFIYKYVCIERDGEITDPEDQWMDLSSSRSSMLLLTLLKNTNVKRNSNAGFTMPLCLHIINKYRIIIYHIKV